MVINLKCTTGVSSVQLIFPWNKAIVENIGTKMNGFDYIQQIDVKGWLVSTLLLSIGLNETS